MSISLQGNQLLLQAALEEPKAELEAAEALLTLMPYLGNRVRLDALSG